MDYNPDHGMLLLSRTPRVLDGWLRGVPEESPLSSLRVEEDISGTVAGGRG